MTNVQLRLRRMLNIRWGVSFVVLTTLFSVVFACVMMVKVDAVTTVPTKMNFQGRLTTAAGATVADGTYNMKFRILDAPTSGNLKWSEERAVSASTGVTVTGGVFSVRLGDVTSLPANIFDGSSSLYFEVELPTPATATCSTLSCATWTEGAMTPRNPVSTSAYAFNSDTLDGLDSSVFAQIGANNSFTGTNTFSSAVTVSGTSTSLFAVKNAAANPLFAVNSTDNTVKIGDATTARATLFVLGSDSVAGDPPGIAGAMYYNSINGRMRCYELSAWSDCVSANTERNKKLVLSPEYAGAVLNASEDTSCVSTNNGTMTSGFSLASNKNYYKWTTAQATAQCYDIVIKFQVPSDFLGGSSTSVNVEALTSTTSVTTHNIELLDNSGTTLTGYEMVSFSPASASTWTTWSGPSLSSGVAANDIVTARIRLTAPQNADVRVGNLTFNYKAK